MVAKPTTPFRSANAGEMSRDAEGRVDIKQYYSALLRAKNVEPVPQGGFRQMGGSWHMGEWRRPRSARAITSPATNAGPHTGTQTIWTGDVAGTVATVLVSGLVISAGSASFFVEAETAPGVWTLIGGPFSVSAGAAQSRLAAFAPGQQRAATSLRIRATFTTAATVTIVGVSASFENGTALRPRFAQVTLDNGAAVICYVTAGMADIWTETGFKGSAALPAVTAGMLLELDFYAEGQTIGIFHRTLETARLFLVTPSQLSDWRADLWPYAPVPTANLGGVYPKTSDVWIVTIRYNDNPYIFVSLTVNGETTPAISLKIAGGGANAEAADGDWNLLASELTAAINELPGIGGGVTGSAKLLNGGEGGACDLTFTFGGQLAGEEFQLSSLVTNTTNASALPVHARVGETAFEPLFSSLRGWPGTSGLVQDRQAYARIPAAVGALALSRIGEYFDLNDKAQNDAAARLDRLRSQTSETILHVVQSTYLLLFTDRGVYFTPNRTIERNTPLNFVKVSEIGAQATAKPFELEGEVHYVGINPEKQSGTAQGGNQILKAVYDDVSTKYSTAPISLLASHLISGVLRSITQAALSDLEAARAWLMRGDGRLIAGQFISTQEITGFVEWIAATGGLVREIGIDGKNKLWLSIERAGGRTSTELYDMSIFLQDAVTRTPDLAGMVSNLQAYEGSQVYAVADGYVLGPFTVAGGQIDLQDAYASAIVGRWQPPLAESMPQVYVNGNDEVIWRPGRIHTVNANLIETTSLAVGANGQPPVDVILHETTDLVDQPMPAKTKLITVPGDQLLGSMVGATVVFTQTRPGALRIRDYSLGTKL